MRSILSWIDILSPLVSVQQVFKNAFTFSKTNTFGWMSLIIDIASMNKKPGEIDVLKLEQVKEQERYLDVHGISATDPLHELEDHVNIRIVACEPENVPDEMELGLSETLENSIPKVIEKVKEVLLDLLDN